VQRYRPINDPDLIGFGRKIKGSSSWSYFSGHASNSSGAILIIFMVLKNFYKKAWLLFLFPLVFAYTRIYLGLHFPLDILSDYVFGLLSCYLFIRLYVYVCNKYQLKNQYV